MGSLEEELAIVRDNIRDIPFTELIACHRTMVQVRYRQTDHRQLVLSLQFPEGYPTTHCLLVEAKSKTISYRMLEGIVGVCDQELRGKEGHPQMLHILKFVNDFLSNNPFVVCLDELNYIKRDLAREGDTVKVKQKAGTILYRACEKRYFIDFKVSLPNDYPKKNVTVEVKDANFPGDMMTVITGHYTEMLRQCVEPPLLRKPKDAEFAPKPSLQLVVDYLVRECVRRFPNELCHICGAVAFPQNPQSVIADENHPDYVYRVYCGHFYHRRCIEQYMKTPPFSGGKRCVICGQRIAHDKWNLSPHVAEQRWAHQQARQREIDEVVDFMS